MRRPDFLIDIRVHQLQSGRSVAVYVLDGRRSAGKVHSSGAARKNLRGGNRPCVLNLAVRPLLLTGEAAKLRALAEIDRLWYLRSSYFARWGRPRSVSGSLSSIVSYSRASLFTNYLLRPWAR
jgi:hypothetical protein